MVARTFTFTVVAAGGSPLAVAAQNLPPGTWGTLAMNGLNSSWTDGGDSFLSFAPHGEWDSLHNRLVFVGGTHSTVSAPAGNKMRQFDYDDVLNTWTRNDTVIPLPGDGNWDHGYYHLAVNPATGDLYRKIYGSDFCIKRLWNAGAWTGIAANPLDDWNLAIGSLVWHPGLYGGEGGLILGAYEGFASWRPSTNVWTILRQVSNTMGTSSNHNAVYNRADQCAYFFNEGFAWKVTAAGVVSAVAAPPVTPTTANINSGGCVYSSTGTNRMVMLTSAVNGKAIYEYNHVTNAWANIGTYPFSYSNSFTGFTCDTYGCLVFIMTTSSNTIGTTAYVWKR